MFTAQRQRRECAQPLTLDDDVLSAAQALAAQQNRPIGLDLNVLIALIDPTHIHHEPPVLAGKVPRASSKSLLVLFFRKERLS